MPLRR